MANNTQIAETILQQLGGYNKLNMMIGLKDVFTIENGLSFKIKMRGSKVNYVKITLNSLDLYDIELGKLRAGKYKVIKESNGVYSDMLKPIIARTSGLNLSL